MTLRSRARETSFASCESVQVLLLSILEVLLFITARRVERFGLGAWVNLNDADSGKSREALALSSLLYRLWESTSASFDPLGTKRISCDLLCAFLRSLSYVHYDFRITRNMKIFYIGVSISLFFSGQNLMPAPGPQEREQASARIMCREGP